MWDIKTKIKNTMTEYRNLQIPEIIREALATFIERESNLDSMITITKVDSTNDFKRVNVFVTVFPEHKEQAALDFLKRQRSEARTYLKKNTRLGRIPHIEIELDEGEKSRQRIDEISREIKDS